MLESSDVAKDGYDIRTLIGFIQKSLAISDKAAEIIWISWKQSTEKKCNGHIKQFIEFCHKQETNPRYATTETDIEFLTKCLNTGVSYFVVTSFHSALFFLIECFYGIPFRKAPMISRFLGRVFNVKPTLPKYEC